MSQMSFGRFAIVIGLTHGGPSIDFRLMRCQINVINVGQIMHQNSHFVVCGFPIANQIGIPMLGKADMSIQLHGKVFTAVQTMCQVTGKDGTDGKVSIHLEAVNL